MQQFQGQVVWITGASSGIGEALAYAFAAKGAHLVLSARRQEELERVRANCSGSPLVMVLPLDLESTAGLEGLADSVIRQMGKIDIMVHNAGISQRSLIKDTSIAVARKIMEVNFFGAVRLTNCVLPHFMKRDVGQFVVISSVTGLIGFPYKSAYSASKHALEGFFSAMRAELWTSRIKILMVHPLAINTDIAKQALKGDGQLLGTQNGYIGNGLSALACAEQIIRAVLKRKKSLMPGLRKEQRRFLLYRWWPSSVFNYVKRLA